MILPPFEGSLGDKLIIFKVQKHDMPMPTASGAERTAFWNALVSELPAYVHFVLNDWKIEQVLVSQRYGVTHFQHPDVLLALGELSPEVRLLELIDAEIFKLPTTSEWEGTSIELENRLANYPSDVAYQARNLFTFQAPCGTYLGRLKKLFPNRILYQKSKHDKKVDNQSTVKPLW